MGIRIHKILGYGFVNLKPNDNRINPNGILGEQYDHSLSFTGFLKHCKIIVDNDKQFKRSELHVLINNTDCHNTKMDNILTYDPEDGDPSIFCITPPENTDWQRSDDIIDHYNEYTQDKYEPISYAKVLTVPIYPYNGYINKNTGKPVNTLIRELIYQFRHAEIELHKPSHLLTAKEHENAVIMWENSLKQLDCSLHWTEKWNVAIPDTVIEFCRYTKLFNDDSTIYSLQPMIYTMWY